MAMDEFMQRLKAVVQEIVAPGAVAFEAVVPLMNFPTASVFGVRSSTVTAGSVDGASSVPTALGVDVASSVYNHVADLPSLSKL